MAVLSTLRTSGHVNEGLASSIFRTALDTIDVRHRDDLRYDSVDVLRQTDRFSG